MKLVYKVLALALLTQGLLFAQLLDGNSFPVFSVGKQVFYKGQIDTMIQALVAQQFQGREPTPQALEQARDLVVSQMISKELLKKEVKAAKVQPDQGLVDSIINTYYAQAGSKENFNKFLDSRGSTPGEFLDKVREEVASEVLLRQVVPPPADPTEKEMAEYFEKNKHTLTISDSIAGAQIVLGLSKNETKEESENKRKVLEGLKAMIELKMADFSVLAAQFSQDQNAAQTGGQTGKFVPAKLGKSWDEATKGLKVGELSSVFKSDKGWHLFMMIQRNDGKYESYKKKIELVLMHNREQQRMDQIREYLKTLEKKYPVNFTDPSYKIDIGKVEG